MPKRNKKFGDWGERLAEDFLVKRGYSVLERNFRKQCGEIDIICRREDNLHFVEVKTRTLASTQRFGLPQEAVTKTKQKKIIQTAMTFLAEKGYGGNINWQIDVVSITYSEKDHQAKINLIENAVSED